MLKIFDEVDLMGDIINHKQVEQRKKILGHPLKGAWARVRLRERILTRRDVRVYWKTGKLLAEYFDCQVQANQG